MKGRKFLYILIGLFFFWTVPIMVVMTGYDLDMGNCMTRYVKDSNFMVYFTFALTYLHAGMIVAVMAFARPKNWVFVLAALVVSMASRIIWPICVTEHGRIKKDKPYRKIRLSGSVTCTTLDTRMTLPIFLPRLIENTAKRNMNPNTVYIWWVNCSECAMRSAVRWEGSNDGHKTANLD